MKAAAALRPERGDYERWVREHHAAVWRAARRILRDDALASDVAQRVYLRALEHGLALAPGESPERLLCWLACKESLTELRGRRRRAAHEERAAMADDDAGPGPFEQASAAEARAWLARELDALAEDLRTVLVLRYQQGLTLREIGALLELAESSVHERVERGLGRLRKRAERAGLAGMLVDWSGELSACEPALVPPAALAPSLLKTASPAAAWSASSLLVPACVLLAACVAVVAWWKLAPLRSDAAAVAPAVAALDTFAAPRTVDAALGASEREPIALSAPEPSAPALAAAAPTPMPTSLVRGRVLDCDRVPLHGIGFWCVPRRNKADALNWAKIQQPGGYTDELGRIAVDAPRGWIYDLQLEGFVGDYAPVRIDLEQAELADLGDIVVAAHSDEIYGDWTLAVTTVDELRQPLPRIQVFLSATLDTPGRPTLFRREVTDANGYVEFRGDRRGEFAIETDSVGKVRQIVSLRRTLAFGAQALELVVPQSRVLEGRLITPGGEPLRNRGLYVRQDSRVRSYDPWEDARSFDASGRFRFEGLSDRPLELHFSDAEFSCFVLRYDALPPSPLVLELKRADDPRDVGTHTGELHGRFVDAQGRSVEVEPWALRPVPVAATASADFWSEVAPSLGAFKGQVAFGPDGPPPPSAAFHETGLEPGRYALVASVPGYALGIAGPFEIQRVGEHGATIVDGIELVLERPWTLVAEFGRGPATPAQGEGLWLESGSGEPTALAGQVVGETIEWTGLHPRIPYRIVLQGANGARVESQLVRTSGSGREVVRFDGWPGRP